jgi:hypothetical protein
MVAMDPLCSYCSVNWTVSLCLRFVGTAYVNIYPSTCPFYSRTRGIITGFITDSRRFRVGFSKFNWPIYMHPPTFLTGLTLIQLQMLGRRSAHITRAEVWYLFPACFIRRASLFPLPSTVSGAG